MNEEQTLLVSMLRDAIQAVYQEERFLLEFAQRERVGLEQAFVFRTGIHLSNILIDSPYEALDLDSEYNKNHGNVKTSKRLENGLRPDLIIHRRDSHEKNMIVAEFKGWWNKDLKTDIIKLEDLTAPNDNYHYLIGVLVLIGNSKPTYRYFINGVEYE